MWSKAVYQICWLWGFPGDVGHLANGCYCKWMLLLLMGLKVLRRDSDMALPYIFNGEREGLRKGTMASVSQYFFFYYYYFFCQKALFLSSYPDAKQLSSLMHIPGVF